MGRIGETVQVTNDDWDHNTDSYVNDKFSVDLRGAKSGYNMVVDIELSMAAFDDITHGNTNGLEL